MSCKQNNLQRSNSDKPDVGHTCICVSFTKNKIKKCWVSFPQNKLHHSDPTNYCLWLQVLFILYLKESCVPVIWRIGNQVLRAWSSVEQSWNLHINSAHFCLHLKIWFPYMNVTHSTNKLEYLPKMYTILCNRAHTAFTFALILTVSPSLVFQSASCSWDLKLGVSSSYPDLSFQPR